MCGADITGLAEHPRAKLCNACRQRKRAPYTHKCAVDYTPIVREYLDRKEWPQFVRPRYIIETDAGVVAALGLVESDIKTGSRKMSVGLRHLYAGIRQIVGPNGERYIRDGKTSKTYVMIRPDTCDCVGGVTA